MDKSSRSIALREIAGMVGCAAPPGDVQITGIATLADAGPGDISFLGSEAFVKQFKATRAAAVLVQKNVHIPETPGAIVLAVDDADLAMAAVLASFAQPAARPKPGNDPQAKVDPSAQIGADVSIGAFCVIGPGARIGRGSIIHPQVYVGEEVEIGEDCEIFPQVTIRERVRIGSRVVIHAGSVLGMDGFGYHWDGTQQVKIPQIGTVIVEDDVEIGSCVCVDRAKFSVTRIGRGTKIDNLVQIAHNVTIGPHSVIAGQAGLAGSASLGTRVTLGGQSALRDHVDVGDGAMVAACAAVANDVAAGTAVSGMPALPHRQSLREQAAMRRLPDLVIHVRKLQEEIEQLRALLPPGGK
ncbi:MAG: UDP-3-O-(3-hydroxymyristoyl)glucosamine N-acyltransferase [Tepidisphaeraceae bacterium]